MPPAHPQGFFGPSQPGSRPVLVLHAWWGLNDTIRALCTRLAQAGFTAFAPDLYEGRTAASIPEAEALSGALFANLDRPRAGVAEGLAFLGQHSPHPGAGTAVLGFSLGAFFALDASIRTPEQVHQVVIYYGTCPADYSPSRAAYLGHFAEADEFEPPEAVDGLARSLAAAGRPHTFHHYPGTGHWFAEADRPRAYNPAAAALAWERTLQFLGWPG